MSDSHTTDKKTDDKTATPDVSALMAKIEKLEADRAYDQREIQRLKTVKDDRDKMVDDKAKTGDPEAIEKLKKELRDEFATREEKLKADLDKQSKELKHERVVRSAISKAADVFNSDALELIQSRIEQSCDWEDGQIIVKDEKGEVRYSETNKREKMGLDEFLGELRNKYPSCAKPTGTSGTDNGRSKSSSSSGRPVTFHDLAGMTPEQQRKALTPEAATEILKGIKLF